MDLDLLTNILYATVRTGTPLILIALGEIVVEKSGVLNLGQEGMLLMGAVCGFIAAIMTGHAGIGVLIAIFSGIVMAFIFAVLSISLVTNQVATGLALTIFATGLSAFIGSNYVGLSIDGISQIQIPLLSDLPILGKALFSHDPLVYLTWALVITVYFIFKSSRLGLIIRSVGENPEAANAIGINVAKVRYLCVLFGGSMTGLAGGYLSLAYTPLWSEGMSSGRGWIALALVVFASWKVGRMMLGAYLFGVASILHLVLQGLGLEASPNLLAMLPYVATIFVLMLLGSNAIKAKLNTPMSLGKPYRPQV